MYLVTRRFKVDPDSIDEITEVARDKFLPELIAIPGFKAFYHAAVAEDTVVSVTIFADRAGVEESNRLSVQTIRDYLPDVMPEAPEIVEGEVLVQEVLESLAA